MHLVLSGIRAMGRPHKDRNYWFIRLLMTNYWWNCKHYSHNSSTPNNSCWRVTNTLATTPANHNLGWYSRITSHRMCNLYYRTGMRWIPPTIRTARWCCYCSGRRPMLEILIWECLAGCWIGVLCDLRWSSFRGRCRGILRMLLMGLLLTVRDQ